MFNFYKPQVGTQKPWMQVAIVAVYRIFSKSLEIAKIKFCLLMLSDVNCWVQALSIFKVASKSISQKML